MAKDKGTGAACEACEVGISKASVSSPLLGEAEVPVRPVKANWIVVRGDTGTSACDTLKAMPAKLSRTLAKLIFTIIWT